MFFRFLLKTLPFHSLCQAGRGAIPTHIQRAISPKPQINIAFGKMFFKEYSGSVRVVYRLINFAIVVLNLLIFKGYVVIGISKIQFFNFSSTEEVKQNQKKLETIRKVLRL